MDAFELHDCVLSNAHLNGGSLDAPTLSLVDLAFRLLYEHHWGPGAETRAHVHLPIHPVDLPGHAHQN
jgi:hypothetical protein